MQVFTPYPDFHLTAEVLDQKRLNKQLVEGDQILRVILETTIAPDGLVYPRVPKGWTNHPAVRAWRATPEALYRYCAALEAERNNRGYIKPHKSLANMRLLLAYSGLNFRTGYMPDWWGREDVHSSHRSRLLAKDPEHYGQFGWTDDPTLDYVWPV